MFFGTDLFRLDRQTLAEAVGSIIFAFKYVGPNARRGSKSGTIPVMAPTAFACLSTSIFPRPSASKNYISREETVLNIDWQIFFTG